MKGIFGNMLENPLNYEMTALLHEMQLKAKKRVIELAQQQAA